jgi:hypothetical protein
MLAFTSSCVAVACSSEERVLALIEYWWLCYVFMGVGIIFMLIIVCKKDCARKVPNNYLLLAAFTICWSGMVMMFCAFYDPISVLIAAVTTFAMTLGCTLIALCVPGEMTWLWGIAGALSCVLFPLIIFSWFFYSRMLVIVISAVGAILSSIYIVLDTKHIMTRLNLDEYIIGALFLYCDIIQLFLWILSLLGGR